MFTAVAGIRVEVMIAEMMGAVVMETAVVAKKRIVMEVVRLSVIAAETVVIHAIVLRYVAAMDVMVRKDRDAYDCYFRKK